MKTKRNTIKRRLIRSGLKVCLVMAILSFVQVLTFKFIDPPATVNMAYEWVMGTFFDAPYVPVNYQWTRLDKISPHLRRAVMASEDQRFLIHNGFDFKEIRNVLEDIVSNGKIRGASTISMQAARSLFLPFSKSLWRKTAEAWYTILMELTWDKKRIFEVYLNTVDWGSGIVGAQAGAKAYFSCDAQKLSRSQAATMAAILPSPHRWSAANPGPHVRKRRDWILGQMEKIPLL